MLLQATGHDLGVLAGFHFFFIYYIVPSGQPDRPPQMNTPPLPKMAGLNT